MTRKQALSLAMQALSANGQQEAAAVLEQLQEELPLTHWSDASIRDAVEQYILDHGKVPSLTAFKHTGLPPHTVIRRRYGQNLRSWLDENYPSPPKIKTDHLESIRAFIEEYQRICPSGAKDFNARRRPGVRCWETIARYQGVRLWGELIHTLNLPRYSPKQTPPHTPFRVQIYAHYDFQE